MNTNFKFYKDLYFLVIDDDPRFRAYVMATLTELGFEKACIQTAVHGQDALNQIKNTERKFEFFIIDLVMPEMTGLEFLAELKSFPEYDETPKLILSTEADSNIILSAIEAGANNYVTKPCEKSVLARKMYECTIE